MKTLRKTPLYADPTRPEQKRYHIPDVPCAQFGNRMSAAENLTEDQNRRREQGLFKTWANQYKKRNGIRMVKKQSPEVVRRRYKAKVVKELREIQDIARMNAEDAIKVATEIMHDPLSRGSDRLAAAHLVLERAYGKATQTNVNANVNANGSAKEVSAKELDQRVKAALDRVESITGGAAKPAEGGDRSPNVRKRYRHPSGSAVH